MNNYLVNIDDPILNGGQKAKNDITHFLTEDGFKELNIPIIIHPEDRSWGAQIRKFKDGLITIPKAIKNIQSADNIVFQYPIYSAFIMNKLIPAIKKYTHANLIIVIHDLESIRMFQNGGYQQDEMNILNDADLIISHNQFMTNWLKQQHINAKIVNLNLFDYYNPQPLNTSNIFNRSVVFAGNLVKSEFLTKFNPDFSLTLFGPNPATQYQPNISYQGNLNPDELPAHLTQNFGLVWDGTSTTTCDGTYGHYLKYNNPHKTSLYLSSGLPVIIWKEAALAPFIIKNNVGFAVSSLDEINDRLNQMTIESYQLMKGNVVTIAEKLRSGYFIKTAMEKALKGLEEN